MAQNFDDPYNQIASTTGPIDFVKAPPVNFFAPEGPPSPDFSSLNQEGAKPLSIDESLDAQLDNITSELFKPTVTKQTLYQNAFVPEQQTPQKPIFKPTEKPDIYYASPDIEKYKYQDDFVSRGFNPANPMNEKNWVADETWSSAMGKALDGFSSRFGNTFHDYWKSYGRMADALVNWDLSKMMPSESEMLALYYEDQKNAMKNFVFVDPSEEDSLFSKRNVADFVSNAGFALGSFAGLGIELAADAALTAITAPAGGEGALSFGATAARFFSKIGLGRKVVEGAEAAKTTSKFNEFFQGIQLGMESPEVIKQSGNIQKLISEAESVSKLRTSSEAAKKVIKDYSRILSMNLDEVAKSKSFADFAMSGAKGLPLIGNAFVYGERIAAGAEAGLSGAKLAGIAARGLHRTVQEYNLSSSEAVFESITSYGDAIDNMVKTYREEHNGQNPGGYEFTRMKDYANQAAFSNYKTNMAILLSTNRLQFGNLLSKFVPATRLTSDLLQQGADNILKVNRVFKSSNLLAREYKKGFMGTYGLLTKINTDFGKKQMLFELGNALRKDLFKFQAIEGLQENMQEASSIAWKEYYTNRYKGVDSTIEEAFGKGVEAQFTKQGLNTFLQGALTGTLIALPTHFATHALQGIQNKATSYQYRNNPTEDPVKLMHENIDNGIKLRNDLYKKMSDGTIRDVKVFNMVTQMEGALQQTEASAKKSEIEWHNAHDNIVLSAAISANQMGTIDVLTTAFREMGNTMTPEQLEQQWGIKLSDTKYTGVPELMNSVANKLQKYSDIVDGLRKKISVTTDPMMYEIGSKDRILASLIRRTQEDAVRIISANALKVTANAERIQTLYNEISAYEEIGNSSDMILRALTNPDKLESEIGIVLNKIELLKTNKSDKALSDDLRKQASKDLESQYKILAKLDMWKSFWADRKEIINAGVDEETKEPITITKNVPFAFIGKKQKDKVKVLNDNDEVVGERDHYDLYAPEVFQVLKDLINAKNQELGIDTTISETTIQEVGKKLIDYIQLSSDAKDYMNAHDALFNPDYAKQMLGRMLDGNFKFEILNLVETIKTRINETVEDIVIGLKLATEDELQDLRSKIYKAKLKNIKVADALTPEQKVLFKKYNEYFAMVYTAVYESTAYKSIMAYSIDPKLGIEHYEFTFENYNVIEKILKDELKRIVDLNASEEIKKDKPEQPPAPGPESSNDPTEVITDEDEESFKDGNISEELLMMIGQKTPEARSEREQRIYESRKDQIEALLRSTSRDEPEPETETQPIPEQPVPLASSPETDAIDLEIVKKQTLIDNLPDRDGVGNGYIYDGIEILPSDELTKLEKELDDLKVKRQQILQSIPEIKPEEVAPKPEKLDTVENHATVIPAEENGFNVVTVDNIVVNPQPIPNKEEADKQAEEMNTNVRNITFLTDLLSDDPDIGPVMISSIASNALLEMEKYNEKSKTLKFFNLEDFYKNRKGRTIIESVVEQVKTGKTKQELKKDKKKGPSKGKTENKFDTTGVTEQTTTTTESAERFKNLGKEIVSLEQADEKEIAKFVDDNKIDDTDISNIIDEINGCTS